MLMPHIPPASANETIRKKIGDYFPVFYNAFAQSAQSSETIKSFDAPDKIFTTVSSTTFVRPHRYSQHKVKVFRKGFKQD